MNRVHAFLFSLAVSVCLATASSSEGTRWYVLEMLGQRAGWTVETQTTEDDRIISTSESRLTIKRGSTSLEMRMTSRFVESASGSPIEMVAKTDIGGSPTEDRYVFTADGVVWTATQEGAHQSKTLALPEGRWLPPAAAARYIASRLAARAEEITVRTIDPLSGLEPVITVRSGFERVPVELVGRTAEGIRCETRSSQQADAVSTEFLDEHGNLLRSELDLGAMSITVIAADEELAKSDLDPPELMRRLFVTPDRPIKAPYQKTSCTFVVRATAGTLPELPTAGGQVVESLGADAARVSRVLGQSSELLAHEDRAVFLASSAMLTSDDPRVVELARSATAGSARGAAARAEACRRFVHRHIRTKDLSVGFASASETARSREGDCTEHGVLLAAMLRAEGIPSRVVSGLIYADRFAGGEDIFGYHMWTQALVEVDGSAKWIDLDATLPDGLPMTATHIALGVHDLSGDSRVNALVDLASLMGRLSVIVERAE